jgi:gamma-glutamylcyclotransferase (GGCT)/AIG2-like uncharacterized protein YtfP
LDESGRRYVVHLENVLDDTFQASHTLVVYGTLAPGEINHHILAGLSGTWSNGVVEGDLWPAGWGATSGFPALSWRPGGPPVPVQVLRSPALPAAWDHLDRFEGDGYRRIVVPIFRANRLVGVGNISAIRRTVPSIVMPAC